MAQCVMSVVHDTDEGGLLPVTACMVHASYTPCLRNGEPAATLALHADTRPSRDEVVLFWWRRTLGQRTLIIHYGPDIEDVAPEREHEQSMDCWCSPELIPASREPIPRPRPGSGVWPL